MKTKITLLALALASVSAFAGNETARSVPFAGGEHLRYVIRYGILHAGFSTLDVEEGPKIKGRRTWKITSQAWSNKVMDLIYKVRDRNESWMDQDGLYSHHFEQDLHEGSFAAQRWVDYDYEAGRFVRIEKRGDAETRKEGSLPGPVQDIFSSLYYARTLPLEVGKSYDFLANSDGKNWTLRVNVLKKDTVNVRAGRFSCVVVEPILQSEGIFKNKGRLLVWITDDDKRTPVLVRSKVSIGAVSAELIKEGEDNE